MASVIGAEIQPVDRVWLSEVFYERCYSAAIWATLMLCAVAGLLAFVDEQSAPEATIGVACVIGGLAIKVRGTPGYLWLRERPNILAAIGPVVALSALWPAVDENAIYFPALGVLALIACVASRLRDAAFVVGSVALGTFVAAVLDFRSPALATAEQLATATLAVVVCGALLAAIASWCAIWVIEQADTVPETGLQPPDPASIEDRLLPAPTATVRHVALPLRAAEAMASWINAIRDLLGTVRFRAASSRLTNFRARELQVLLLRAGGFDHAEIAGFLSVKISTVRRYESSAAESQRRRVAAARLAGTASFQASGLGELALTPAGIADELVARFPDERAVRNLAARAGAHDKMPKGAEQDT
jgi:DNA-binding CsgD family transcriptional regulator